MTQVFCKQVLRVREQGWWSMGVSSQNSKHYGGRNLGSNPELLAGWCLPFPRRSITWNWTLGNQTAGEASGSLPSAQRAFYIPMVQHLQTVSPDQTLLSECIGLNPNCRRGLPSSLMAIEKVLPAKTCVAPLDGPSKNLRCLGTISSFCSEWPSLP